MYLIHFLCFLISVSLVCDEIRIVPRRTTQNRVYDFRKRYSLTSMEPCVLTDTCFADKGSFIIIYLNEHIWCRNRQIQTNIQIKIARARTHTHTCTACYNATSACGKNIGFNHRLASLCNTDTTLFLTIPLELFWADNCPNYTCVFLLSRHYEKIVVYIRNFWNKNFTFLVYNFITDPFHFGPKNIQLSRVLLLLPSQISKNAGL